MRIAEYDDVCALCDESIHEGDKIGLVDEEWCHSQCIEDEGLEEDKDYYRGPQHNA